MSSTTPAGGLPPGNDGLPLVGETLAFAKNPFRFIEERLSAHGRIFRSRVLGRSAVVLAGPEAAAKFIDGSIVKRDGAMPPHVQELFGGLSLPSLDGEVHKTRKLLVLAGFNRAALTAYLPVIQKTIEQYFVRWSSSGEIRWLDEMKRLAIEVICTTVIGMEPGAEMDQIRADYAAVLNGFATLPINLPGTRYRKALQARDRILAVLQRKVRERKLAPSGDGLSRILEASTKSGAALSDEDAALELHHIVIAGFIIYGEVGELVQQLTAHPDVRSRLEAEISSKAGSGELALETLVAMPYLIQVVNEVKRVCRVVPAVFGKAKQAFQFDGATVPAGWTVMWAVQPSHVAQSMYSEPEKFDPDRFSPERAEGERHEHAFSPQGAGPATGHRCPGIDFTTYFMEMFGIVLLRDYTWTIPPQNFEMDYSKTPPEPKDALRATVRRK